MNFIYVYVLLSHRDGGWYTGYTEDLRKRYAQHQAGDSASTRYRGPWEIIYYEASLNIDDARARERYLKSGMGKRYIKNRLKPYFARREEDLYRGPYGTGIARPPRCVNDDDRHTRPD